jgi:hypothetical protein
MAETPFTPAAPEGQPAQPAAAPAEAAAAPAEPAAPAADPSVEAAETVVEATETVVEAVVEAVVEEEPEVKGWSGSPSAASAPEALARPGDATAEPDAPAASEPGIAATLEVPPLPGAGNGAEAGAEGGEFDLLIGKVSAWLEGLQLAERWQKLRGPLRGAALLLGLLLALRLYAQVVGTIDGIPVISGLLELTGLVYALWFGATKLIRTSERERVLADWKQRWQSFSGRD